MIAFLYDLYRQWLINRTFRALEREREKAEPVPNGERLWTRMRQSWRV